jgi:hypothetical protein
VKRLPWATAILLLLSQLLRPDRRNAPFDPNGTLESRAQVPERIRGILRRSCYDCHSEETRWPWWSSVAPASWLIARDVRVARHALDFSRWEALGSGKEREKLDGICELSTSGEMPPRRYSLLHRGARLSAEETDLICAWTHLPRTSSGLPQGKAGATDSP